jgi:histidine triad (HIT) family protein
VASIFSKIIQGEIPCYKIAENETCFAFLDINPLKIGHTLVVPKTEVDNYFDLPNTTLNELGIFSKQIASAIKKTFPCNRVSMQVIGLEVPHAHIHLIPINTMNDCNFSNSKLSLSKEEFEQIALQIREKL